MSISSYNWNNPWNGIQDNHWSWNNPAVNSWSSWSPSVYNQTFPTWSSADTSSSQTSDSKPVLTYEESLKLLRLKKKKKEIEKEYKIEQNIEDIKEQKQQIEKNKKEDGSSTYTVSYKKQGFWGKTGRWLVNAGTALVNTGKSLLGIESDGSWNWKKCLKNVGIAALAVGATGIPVLGPAIGYGLLAAGGISGAVGVVKGVSRLKNAKTDEEIDKAQQDICTGAFIGITSVFGLRGVGKAYRTSAGTASHASHAAARTGLGKVVETVSNFGRDITVNALRATVNSMKSERIAITSISGFFKNWGAKIYDSFKNFNDWRERFKKQQNELETTFNNKLTDVTNKLNVETNPAKKALLQEEKAMLEANLNEIRSLGTRIKTKADFDKLLKDNASTFNREYAGSYTRNANGGYEINGRLIAPDRYNQFLRNVTRTQKLYNSKLKELIKTKENLMRQLAKHSDKNIAQLNEYVPVRTVTRKWTKPSTWRKNEYQLAIGGKNPGKFKEFLGLTLTSPALPTVITIDRLTSEPMYSTPFLFGQDFTPEQTEAQIEALNQQIEEYKTVLSAIENAKSREELENIINVLNGNVTDPQAEGKQVSG